MRSVLTLSFMFRRTEVATTDWVQRKNEISAAYVTAKIARVERLLVSLTMLFTVRREIKAILDKTFPISV